MSLRGFKLDKFETDLARLGRRPLTHRFTNKRSFISQGKQIGDHGGAHLLLYGKDKGLIRAEIFRRNREANGGNNRCHYCKTLVRENADSDEMTYFIGQWHHLRSKSGERCDCVENGVVACPTCHKEKHPRPMFTPQNNLKIPTELS